MYYNWSHVSVFLKGRKLIAMFTVAKFNTQVDVKYQYDNHPVQ